MTVFDLLANAGWPMIPIYACSLAAVAVFVRKLVDLARERLGDTSWLEPTLELLRDDRREAATSRCREAAHPAARAVTAALETWPRRPERAEAEAGRVGSLELQRIERHVGALSFIAQVAPLLGLLGTAIGMVQLFYDLERAPVATIDVSALSSGIWTALLTTAAGLVVGVFALAGHVYVTGRTDRLRLQIHDAVERALTALPPPSAQARIARAS